MPTYAEQGTNKNDYITIDGHTDWATIPADTLPKQKQDIPIRLRVGDQNFGKNHIELRHGKWLKQKRKTVCQMLWEKLSKSSGKFYEGNKKEKKRVKLYVRISPEAVLLLEKQYDKNDRVHFLSVVTIYIHTPKHDEEEIGVYLSKYRNPHIKVLLPMG